MNRLYFFLGTEAELMKMYCVIKEAQKRGYDCRIVASGQNDIRKSPYLSIIGGKIDMDLALQMPKNKTAVSYLKWFIGTKHAGIKRMINENKENSLMLVHGDTLSTLMGSRIALKVGMDYMHVESGFRSFNWFSPFPEEIDRYFASKYAVVNFCQKEEAAEYAAKTFKGKAVNTVYNTGIEILIDAITNIEKEKMKNPVGKKFFLVAIHRQENLLSKSFMKNTFSKIFELSKRMKCVFIYHEQTQDTLKKFDLWDEFENCSNIIKIPRQGYVDFVNYVINSEFIIADGCGNQQEFYYLGKPYLIMRTDIEDGSEGLGWNAVCFKGDYSKIDEFVNNYKDFIKPSVTPKILPSEIIMDEIDRYFDGTKR